MTSVEQISPQSLALEMQIANLIVHRFPKQQKLNECPIENKIIIIIIIIIIIPLKFKFNRVLNLHNQKCKRFEKILAKWAFWWIFILWRNLAYIRPSFISLIYIIQCWTMTPINDMEATKTRMGLWYGLRWSHASQCNYAVWKAPWLPIWGIVECHIHIHIHIHISRVEARSWSIES